MGKTGSCSGAQGPSDLVVKGIILIEFLFYFRLLATGLTGPDR